MVSFENRIHYLFLVYKCIMKQQFDTIFFLSFYSLEDIILLLTFVFSLMGDEFYESPAEIEKLKVLKRLGNCDCLL